MTILFKIINKIMKPFKGRGLSNTRIGKFVYRNFFVPNKPDYIELENFRLYIHKGKDLLSDSLLITKEYEQVETNIIKKLVKKGDIVIDAGANIGYYTILLSQLVGNNGRVYSFEPGKECFKLLKKNIEFNKCNNVIAINKALSDKIGNIKFYIDDNDKASSSIIKNSGTKVIVECTTLDNEIKKPVNFMKIDIEGAELNALLGGTNLLTNCDKIIMEAPGDRGDFKDIKELLVKNNYKIKRIDKGNILCYKALNKFNGGEI